MSRLRNCTALLAILCAQAFAGAGAEDFATRTTRDLTLDDAVQIAVRQNPDILRARQEIQRTRGLVIEVRAQALPQVTVTNTYTQQDKNLLRDFGGAGATTTGQASAAATPAATGTGTTTGSTQTQTSGQTTTVATSSSGALQQSWNVTIGVRQLIYSGGQVSAALHIARLTEDSSYWSLRDTVDTTISNVRKQFYATLLNRALITVQEESIRLLESQLADQEHRFQAGTVPRFNVLQAEVALANARPNLIRARNNYAISELQLAKLLGIEYESAPVGVPPINPVGELATTEQPLPLAESLELAKEQRPLLKVQRQQILIQAENIKVALAGYQPRLEVNGGYEFRNTRANTHLDDVVNGWFFGVTGTWDVFDGGATYGRTKQAKAQLESARITYGDTVQQVELEVQQALDSVRVARETMASQTKAVEEAEEAVRLASERLAAGAGTQLDVLNAQVALTQARTTAYQARYDYNVAMAEFDRVTSRSTKYAEVFDDPLTRKQRATAVQQQQHREMRVERATRVAGATGAAK